MTLSPVNPSTMAAASPTVTKVITALPNTAKPLTMAFSAFHRPNAITSPMITMGTKFRSTFPTGKPAVRPPARIPSGMVTMPHNIPFAMAGRSSSLRIPMATGMTNTMVAPSMDPVSTPPSIAACASCVSSIASAPPPMSQARIVPANMAGSAPRKPNTGTTTGFSTAASTGARVMIPTMAIASDPMARIPLSNSLPSPHRFPKILSTAPTTANTAITAIKISCADIVFPPSCHLLFQHQRFHHHRQCRPHRRSHIQIALRA